MKLKTHLQASVVAAIAVFLSLAETTLATLPEDRYAEFNIRADPTDENSDIVFVYRLHLKANTSDETSVGWLVTQADFEEVGTGGTVVDSWSILEPEVLSNDGLWWVDHAKLSEPEAAEFDSPPSMEGTADYQGTGRGDLEFSLADGYLASGYETMYGGSVASFTHAVQVVNEEDPIVEGDDEPAEVIVVASGSN